MVCTSLYNHEPEHGRQRPQLYRVVLRCINGDRVGRKRHRDCDIRIVPGKADGSFEARDIETSRHVAAQTHSKHCNEKRGSAGYLLQTAIPCNEADFENYIILVILDNSNCLIRVLD